VALAAIVAPLSGCALLGGYDTFDRDSSRDRAEAEVRSAVPAAEAYYADHGTYEGMTLDALRRLDVALNPQLRVASADTSGYCIDFRSGEGAAHTDGPGGEVADGPCA
jgi:hypothetical protein